MPNAAPASDFPFHHGRLALSFAGTIGHRTSDSPLERIATPALLRDWLVAAGLLTGRKPPVPDLATYRRSLDLREAIWGVAQAVVARKKPKRADIDTLNGAVKRWSPSPQLDPATLRLQAREGAEPIRVALGRLAIDALELFGDASFRERLRACEAADCSAIFLDPGRGRSRLWCSMARCGNRAKVAAFRARQKEA